MKTKIYKTLRSISLSLVAMLLISNIICAAPVARTAAGANAAAIQSTVDQFRTDLGGANNGVGGSFTTGRREINWDGVPDNFSAPNFLPYNFFNVNSPRGVIFSSRTTFGDGSAFIVSADSNNATATPVRFGNIDATYTTNFATFSAERLFIARNSNGLTIHFMVPGTNIPATVNGFGAVFTDVDQAGPTFIKYYDETGHLLTFQSAPVQNNGLSFVGVSFNGGERVARVDIVSGNTPVVSPNTDQVAGDDTAAMDDFIYGEPRAAEPHAGDFDGDGFADASVFRASAGTFFILNSGSNTVSFVPFGTVGDVPVQGDFDGDSRADVAIWRAAQGEWWINQSSTGQTIAGQFGSSTDKPTPGDFDKDGKTDVAFWRPSNGNYFVLRSSNGSFFSFPWGQNGDVPVGVPDLP